MTLGKWRAAFAMLAMVSAPGAVLAQAPLGVEFPVNAYTTGNQTSPAVAAAADGSFVVVWRSYGANGADVFARRFDASGAAIGDEIRVNTFTTGHQGSEVVASDADGDFVVVWVSPQDADLSNAVMARRFDRFGFSRGGEFRVNAYTTGVQGSPAVAADSDGGFVVVWGGARAGDTNGLSGRRFSASGAPITGDFAVNSFTPGGQQRPDVAVTDNDEVVVLFEHFGAALDVMARRFDGSGAPLGAEFRVNTYTTGDQWFPSVAPLPAGGFVAAWDSRDQDGSGRGIYHKRYSADAPTGFETEVRVSGHTTGDQLIPEVAADPEGNYLVVWSSDAQDNSGRAVMGRYFAAPQGGAGEFVVNTHTTGSQESPAVAMAADGTSVAVWDSRGQDGDLGGVFAQRFKPDRIFADDFESGDTSAWSAQATSGGDLQVSAAAALKSTGNGLQAAVDDVSGRWVQDDSPEDERQYRVRFYFDTNGFDPGEALNRRRVRLFVAFDEDPLRRVVSVILRRLNGVYALMASARLDDDSRYDTGFFPISDGEHFVELVWRRSTGAPLPNGSLELAIDDTFVHVATQVDNDGSGIDFVRLGAISAKQGASGTLFWDEFMSQRRGNIGP